MLNRRGLGPFTLPMIVLYIVSAVAMLIFVLVLLGYAGSTVPKMLIPNEGQLLANYIADALISLPNWDGECGCLAKSINTPQGEVIYPGLIPKWKLEKIQGTVGIDMCDSHTNFCTVPYFIDQDRGAKIFLSVYDFENRNLWSVPYTTATICERNVSVNRLVAIEYENGIVHAGRLSVGVCH